MALRRFDEVSCFDDYRVGDRFVTEPLTITREDLLAYVERHGPVPVRAYEGRDPDLGREMFPDLATLCLCFSYLIRAGFLRGHGMSSPGLAYLRCPEPVEPGDRVRVELECLESRPSSTRDDRGYVTFKVQMIAERGAVLVEFEVAEVVARQNALAQ
ncbi:MAG TPA: hypothetical protein VM325_07375 [Alphaproteobacteria bacterium]|nr:hypothetical protein [Alphaproteobacteria bacterium]